MTSAIPHSRPWITDTDRRAVAEALDDGMLAEGLRVQRFESAVAAHVGSTRGLACASGTSALVHALGIVGAGPDREVILPTYACRDIADAVRAAGARPILVDNAPERWTADPTAVAASVTSRTAAVIVVHTFGMSAALAPVLDLGVPVIEDCAHAFGRPIEGDLGVFSFHATKCLTTGEGGMVVAGRRDIPSAATSAAPMSDLAAALGLSQLARWPRMLARRNDIAARYRAALPEEWVARAAAACDDRTIPFRFPLWVDDFDDVATWAATGGVHVRRGVDALLREDGQLPGSEAESCFAHTASIPVHPSLSDDDVDRVIEILTGAHAHVAG